MAFLFNRTNDSWRNMSQSEFFGLITLVVHGAAGVLERLHHELFAAQAMVAKK